MSCSASQYARCWSNDLRRAREKRSQVTIFVGRISMKVNKVRATKWLPVDKYVRFELPGPFWFRACWLGKRLVLIPTIAVNWEEGILGVEVHWLPFLLALDWEFCPDWENSEEALSADSDPRNDGLEPYAH